MADPPLMTVHVVVLTPTNAWMVAVTSESTPIRIFVVCEENKLLVVIFFEDDADRRDKARWILLEHETCCHCKIGDQMTSSSFDPLQNWTEITSILSRVSDFFCKGYHCTAVS